MSSYSDRLIFKDHDTEVRFRERAFSSISFEELYNLVDWEQRYIRMFGKTHPEPRLTQWYGAPYSYSSITLPSRPLPLLLQSLKEGAEAFCSQSFNGVLCNFYRDGNDHMGWHRDNEKMIDQSCIASLSFGAERSLIFRNRENKINHSIELKSGSLLTMHNAQQNWEHCIPKRKRVTKPRINLTFRRIIQ